MIVEFSEVLRNRIREEIDSELLSLARGSMDSFDEYKYACGVIRGLELAEQQLSDLMETLKKAGNI
jgi:hypothetical protein